MSFETVKSKGSLTILLYFTVYEKKQKFHKTFTLFLCMQWNALCGFPVCSVSFFFDSTCHKILNWFCNPKLEKKSQVSFIPKFSTIGKHN